MKISVICVRKMNATIIVYVVLEEPAIWTNEYKEPSTSIEIDLRKNATAVAVAHTLARKTLIANTLMSIFKRSLVDSSDGHTQSHVNTR